MLSSYQKSFSINQNIGLPLPPLLSVSWLIFTISITCIPAMHCLMTNSCYEATTFCNVGLCMCISYAFYRIYTAVVGYGYGCCVGAFHYLFISFPVFYLHNFAPLCCKWIEVIIFDVTENLFKLAETQKSWTLTFFMRMVKKH